MKNPRLTFLSLSIALLSPVLLLPGLPAATRADEAPQPDITFLQTIQDQLTTAHAVVNETIRIQITPERKRRIDVTPSSISFSHGFLKNMTDIHQMVATMAHMTAHISHDTTPTPPLPADEATAAADTSVSDYVKSTIRPEYPDKSDVPQATGSFHEDRAKIIERPTYRNDDYSYAIDKSDIIRAEQELEADRTTVKILRHAGLCPSDYSRMLHYFYENPQKLLANRHFALTADQWQRIDAVDRLAPPDTECSAAETAVLRDNAARFDQLKEGILAALASTP